MQLPSCVAISVNGDEFVVPDDQNLESCDPCPQHTPARRDTHKNAKSEDRPVRMLVKVRDSIK